MSKTQQTEGERIPREATVAGHYVTLTYDSQYSDHRQYVTGEVNPHLATEGEIAAIYDTEQERTLQLRPNGVVHSYGANRTLVGRRGRIEDVEEQ